MTAATLICSGLLLLAVLAGGAFAVLGGITLRAARPAVKDDTPDATIDELMSVHDAVEAAQPVQGPAGGVHHDCFDRWYDRATTGADTEDPCPACAALLAERERRAA